MEPLWEFLGTYLWEIKLLTFSMNKTSFGGVHCHELLSSYIVELQARVRFALGFFLQLLKKLCLQKRQIKRATKEGPRQKSLQKNVSLKKEHNNKQACALAKCGLRYLNK